VNSAPNATPGLSSEALFLFARSEYNTHGHRYENPDYSEVKAKEVYLNLCHQFAEILRICANSTSLKEDGEIGYGDDKLHSPHSYFIGEKTGFSCTFSMFRGFHLAMKLDHTNNMKLMKDEFWAMFFQLSTTGEFSFREVEKPTKEMRQSYPQLFNKQSSYFKLIRNYVLFEQRYGEVRSLGSVSVKWERDISYHSLAQKCAEAFGLFYKVHFLLWQAEQKKN